jgi:uncharacterized protein
MASSARGQHLWVEVAYATPQCQTLIRVSVLPGATVADAIHAAGLATRHPELDLDRLDVGIHAQRCGLDELLSDGDRVEIYRPLQLDPKERRRRRASGA